MRKRNVALAAAYTAIDTSYKDYRKRVIERFGEEIDKELRYNIKAKTFEETEVDKNGKEKKVEKTVNVADMNLTSDYARYFDSSVTGWEDCHDYMLVIHFSVCPSCTFIYRCILVILLTIHNAI